MTQRSLASELLLITVLASAGAALGGQGLVALQTADPSCPNDGGNRYVDCRNGTVTDNETGLVWLARMDCFGPMNWHEAMESVAGLADLEDETVCGGLTRFECDCGLDDNSSPGEWRLPTFSELGVMIDAAISLSCQDPVLTNDAGNGCWETLSCFFTDECSFSLPQSERYWTSSTVVNTPTHAWTWELDQGQDTGYDKDDNDLPDHPYYIWPVRRGQ